eukprot:scaffold53716_cov67-Phaeocystis_antarctica.AAC.3
MERYSFLWDTVLEAYGANEVFLDSCVFFKPVTWLQQRVTQQRVFVAGRVDVDCNAVHGLSAFAEPCGCRQLLGNPVYHWCRRGAWRSVRRRPLRSTYSTTITHLLST